MAPSNMFSYLRPGHAKRSAANLASSPDPVSSPPIHRVPSPAPVGDEYFSTPRHPENAVYTSGSPVSPFPPQLPPIPRVASKLDRSGNSSLLSPPPTTNNVQLSPAYEAKRPSSSSRSEAESQASTLLAPHYSSHSKSQSSLISGLSEKFTSTSKPSTPTAQPHKSGKSRLNLRNPMSLLMRRRSGQTLEALHDEALVTLRSPPLVPPIPDNYDPSIRGRIVHDFSAPRPNRNFSYNNAYGDEQRRMEPSPPKIDREHTPVFREHFDDDTSYEQSQAAIRAEQLVNKDFLKRNSYIPELPGRSPPPPPPLPKDSSPPLLPPPSETIQQQHASSILSPVQEAPSPTDSPTEITPKKPKSTKTPPSSRSRATSVTDPSFVPAGLPTHLTSRASRFSFQIGGGDSAAQEKILEERHIQKAAEKASKQELRMSSNSMGDDYDDYGLDDDFDMDGGYEEEIPMLGEEDEYTGLGNQTLSPGVAAFDFSLLSIQPNINPLSPLNMNAEVQTPVDGNGNRIGYALSEGALQPLHPPVSATKPEANEPQADIVHGLGLLNLESESVKAAYSDNLEGGYAVSTEAVEFAQAGLGDDLYFDDGMIEEQGEVDDVEFDEDVFDDPDGPLFDRKAKSPTVEQLRTALSSHPPDGLRSETGYEADDDTLTKQFEKSEPSLMHQTSRAHPRSDFSNLNAYHSALADAANRAEAEGRFVRKASIDIGHSNSDADDSSSISNSRPSLIPDDGRFSQDTTGFPLDDDGFGMSSSFMDDYDYSDYDSALEDDVMIAAANSEALANDYEGFYGQEFGFYASAQGEAVNAYGGYFGPSGLGRSISGRNAMREPNLTPITERSEYSTRNSFISINHFRDGTQSLTSPGLAQLARISPYGWRDEEDMSLDSLMKLRKGAFGSTASLPGSTSNSPRNSSPMGMQFIPRTASPAGNRMREQNEDSTESDHSTAITDSFDESEEDDQGLVEAINGAVDDYADGTLGEDLDEGDEFEERPDSPTLTASDYNSLSSPTSHLQVKELPSIPQMPLHSPPTIPMQTPSGLPLPMSPINYALQSPSIVPLPMSPPAHPYNAPPPLTLRTTFMPPPGSSNSPSFSSPMPSATATATSSNAPRRQSLGLISPISTTSPATPAGAGSAWRAGHSRKGSAADSVAYVREQDELGSERWVLERRRTAESGELELIGREIVEGGRI